MLGQFWVQHAGEQTVKGKLEHASSNSSSDSLPELSKLSKLKLNAEVADEKTALLRQADAASTSSSDDDELLSPKSLKLLNTNAMRILWSLGSAVLYGATAVSMNFVNKATLKSFSLVNTVLLFQMLAAIAILMPLKFLKLVSFPAFNVQRARSLLPITILYTANVGFALLGLQSLNIPMYNALKRLTPVIILIVKAYMTKRLPQWNITGSVVCVVAGCMVASLGDFTFDASGYIFALTSVMLQCFYLLLVERSGAEKGVGTAELLFYNSVLSLPFLILVILGTGELPRLVPAISAGVASLGLLPFWSLIATCSLMGVLLNFSLFLCTVHNSALTTTIVGVLKGVLATFLGFFLLGGVEFHPLNVAGITLNMAGGVWYSVIKYDSKKQQQLSKAFSYGALGSSVKDLEGGKGGVVVKSPGSIKCVNAKANSSP